MPGGSAWLRVRPVMPAARRSLAWPSSPAENGIAKGIALGSDGPAGPPEGVQGRQPLAAQHPKDV